MERIFREHLFPVVQRFHAQQLPAGTLPDLPPAEILWRMQFLAGAMIHAVKAPSELAEEMTREICAAGDTDRLAPMMITFFTAAFQAPATETHDAQ